MQRLIPYAVAIGTALAGTVHAPHLSEKNAIGDLLSAPAFRGFAERLLPWDGARPIRPCRCARSAT